MKSRGWAAKHALWSAWERSRENPKRAARKLGEASLAILVPLAFFAITGVFLSSVWGALSLAPRLSVGVVELRAEVKDCPRMLGHLSSKWRFSGGLDEKTPMSFGCQVSEGRQTASWRRLSSDAGGALALAQSNPELSKWAELSWRELSDKERAEAVGAQSDQESWAASAALGWVRAAALVSVVIGMGAAVAMSVIGLGALVAWLGIAVFEWRDAKTRNESAVKFLLCLLGAPLMMAMGLFIHASALFAPSELLAGPGRDIGASWSAPLAGCALLLPEHAKEAGVDLSGLSAESFACRAESGVERVAVVAPSHWGEARSIAAAERALGKRGLAWERSASTRSWRLFQELAGWREPGPASRAWAKQTPRIWEEGAWRDARALDAWTLSLFGWVFAMSGVVFIALVAGFVVEVCVKGFRGVERASDRLRARASSAEFIAQGEFRELNGASRAGRGSKAPRRAGGSRL